jgi:hypothetical protein
MKIFELLKNPLIKWAGMLLILYFALFNNEQNPRSLGNRVSAENIKNNISEATKQGSFIISNVKMVKKTMQHPEMLTDQKYTTFSHNDVVVGSGEKEAACGDEATISYTIINSNNLQLDFANADKIIIGSGQENFFEANIKGMKVGGLRYISIPSGSLIYDKKLGQFINNSDIDLEIQIALLSLLTSELQNLSCN